MTWPVSEAFLVIGACVSACLGMVAAVVVRRWRLEQPPDPSRRPNLPPPEPTTPTAEAETTPHDGREESRWMEAHQRFRTQLALQHRHDEVAQVRQHLASRKLHLHLSPHFMFNALTSVQWLWTRNRHSEALASFRAFAELWRTHWTNEGTTTHALRDEQRALAHYVSLEVQRLGREVHVHWELDASLTGEEHVPIFLVQPLLENVLWHAFLPSRSTPLLPTSSSAPPAICIEAFGVPAPDGSERPWISIRVLDNGVGLPEPSSNPSEQQERRSHGSQLVHDKLVALHPKATFSVAPTTAPWSTVSALTFPLGAPTA